MADSERAGEREEGPTAREVYPPIPANPRPGWRSIVATVAEYGRWRLTRAGLTPDEAIREEVEDYRRGHRDREDKGAYAGEQPDVALWEGERLVAVIRPRGADPEVTRFGQTTDIRVTTGASEHPRLVADGGPGLESIVDYAERQHRVAYCTEIGLSGVLRPHPGADLAIWEGVKLRAVIRILPDASSEVVRFGDDSRAGSPRGPFRCFPATVRDEADRVEGFGMTLERAIERQEDAYRAGFDSDVSSGLVTPEEYAAGNSDVVIWEDTRAMAILRGLPDGTMRVERRDGA